MSKGQRQTKVVYSATRKIWFCRPTPDLTHGDRFRRDVNNRPRRVLPKRRDNIHRFRSGKRLFLYHGVSQKAIKLNKNLFREKKLHVLCMAFHKTAGNRMVSIIWIDCRKQDIGVTRNQDSPPSLSK